MAQEQDIITIALEELTPKVQEFQQKGWRIVQICCTKLEQFELCYSFEKDFKLSTLRILLPSTEVMIPSISPIYWTAFLYENELHDLFGLKIKDIVIDYQGKFYKTAMEHPFAADLKTTTTKPGTAAA